MSAFAKRLTPEDAFCTHPDPFDSAVFLDGLTGVFGAARFKTTRRRKHRRHERLVNTQYVDHQILHYTTKLLIVNWLIANW